MSVTLAEVFEGHEVEPEGGSDMLGVRLGAPVAAALMAALDWMGGRRAGRRGFRARLDETCLEVRGGAGDRRGLQAAGEILALAGGNLQPAADGTGTWRIRVPVAVEYASYLMVEQGGIALAFPWPAVLSVVMARASEVERARLGAPVLPPIGPASERPGEMPVVLLGHGLKRAYFVADRLVWRLRARSLATDETPPAPGLARAVFTDEERYWLADPALLLGPVESPPIPEDALPRPEAAAPPAAPPSAEREPAPPAAPAAPMEERPVARLTREDVEPLGEPPERRPVPAAAARHALVAEDSLIARVFLVRLLERRGFAVTAVASAAELLATLPRERWSLACVDVELGDRGGASMLRHVRDQLAHMAATDARGRVAPPHFVALVRDARDIAAARAAGIAPTLLKPFESEAVDALLAGLDLAG